MDLIVIIIGCLVSIIIMFVLLKVTPRKIKMIKEIGEDKKLNELTNVFPENEIICKEMLQMLKNDKVKIKSGNENSEASLYIVASDSIFIANIKNTFTRIQTIAHECLHSIQDKRLLWFNFIFSNIYIIYFSIITILALFNKISIPSTFAIILILMSIVLFFVRSFLETDAMTKARFLAKEYMLSKNSISSKNDIDIIVENYDKLNNLGIKFTIFSLLVGYLLKVIIFCVIELI